jgi:ribosomal protein L37AE/L43A
VVVVSTHAETVSVRIRPWPCPVCAKRTYAVERIDELGYGMFVCLRCHSRWDGWPGKLTKRETGRITGRDFYRRVQQEAPGLIQRRPMRPKGAVVWLLMVFLGEVPIRSPFAEVGRSVNQRLVTILLAMLTGWAWSGWWHRPMTVLASLGCILGLLVLTAVELWRIGQCLFANDAGDLW